MTTTVIQPSKAAEKLRRLAAAMQAQIDAKRNPGSANQNYTLRRARIVEGMMRDADRLERIQYALLALANGHATGDLPVVLAGVSTRKAVEAVLSGYWSTHDNRCNDVFRLAGIPDPKTLQLAHELLTDLVRPPDRSREKALLQVKHEAQRLVRIVPGYFPTPDDVAEHMIDLAVIREGHRVLEPSCGSGNLIAAILRRHPTADISAIEKNHALVALCHAQGYAFVQEGNFLEEWGTYDRIVMNPPFENGADVDHVRHAHALLAPSGLLVSVMSEGVFFRSDAKASGFREWLSWNNGYDLQLHTNAFWESGTNVQTRLVVVGK